MALECRCWKLTTSVYNADTYYGFIISKWIWAKLFTRDNYCCPGTKKSNRVLGMVRYLFFYPIGYRLLGIGYFSMNLYGLFTYFWDVCVLDQNLYVIYSFSTKIFLRNSYFFDHQNTQYPIPNSGAKMQKSGMGINRVRVNGYV